MEEDNRRLRELESTIVNQTSDLNQNVIASNVVQPGTGTRVPQQNTRLAVGDQELDSA